MIHSQELTEFQHIDQLDFQKFFEFLIFFNNPSLSDGILRRKLRDS